MSAISGSRLSAPSASGSQSTTAPIFHMRRSWCGLLEWVSFLGSVCTVCVCGIIYGGTTQLCQHFNIWTPTPTSHCKSICGRNRRVSHSNPHSDIHTPAYLHGHTITQRIFLNWVKSLGGAGTQDNVFALRDLRCLQSRSYCGNIGAYKPVIHGQQRFFAFMVNGFFWHLQQKTPLRSLSLSDLIETSQFLISDGAQSNKEIRKHF